MDKNKRVSARLADNSYFVVDRLDDGKFYFSLLTNPVDGGSAAAYGITGKQGLQAVMAAIEAILAK